MGGTYLGGAPRVVDGAGEEDAAAAVDDERPAVVRHGRVGDAHARREGGRHERRGQHCHAAAGGGSRVGAGAIAVCPSPKKAPS